MMIAVAGRVRLAPGVFDRLVVRQQEKNEQDESSSLPSQKEVNAWLKEFDLE